MLAKFAKCQAFSLKMLERNISMLKFSNGRISMHSNYQIIFDKNTDIVK